MSSTPSASSSAPKSTTFFSTSPLTKVGADEMSRLKTAAAADPVRRARLCLHQSPGDPVQEMIIAFARGTYVRPHRHHGKCESLHIVEGTLQVVFFDDAGAVTDRVVLDAAGAGHCMYRLSAPVWHTVIPVSEFVVIHEVTSGPYERNDSELASWAPDGTDGAAAARFVAQISR